MDGNTRTPEEVLEERILKEVYDDNRELTEVGSDSYSTQQKQGVLQKIVTAIVDDKEYRQVLLLACFDDKREARLCAGAIAERQRYGVPIGAILDDVIAQCAVKADRVIKVINGMTRFNLNTNQGMPGWKKKQENKSIA
jgi:hypothetical protein